MDVFDCSAGVGRTGTLIALDFLLEQAGCEKIVDIYNCVYNMRKNRVNMIQTLVGIHWGLHHMGYLIG